MAATKEEILEAIASMTVLEVSELVKMMEEKFGVSAAAPVAVAAVGAAAPAAAVEEKTEFNVILKGFHRVRRIYGAANLQRILEELAEAIPMTLP